MTSKSVAFGGAALALLLVSSLWEPAEARRGGGGGGYSRGGGHHSGGHHFRGGGNHFRSGGHHFRGGGRHFRHSHRFRPDIFLYSAPFAYGYYGDYGYSNGCAWLRRRAIRTDSSYWWDRYYACIYGDGYYYDYD